VEGMAMMQKGCYAKLFHRGETLSDPEALHDGI
jgi:hypothetical protein